MCGVYTVTEQIELGFMFHNSRGLYGFFSICLRQSYHISDSYIFFFFLGSWSEAENRFLLLFSAQAGLGVYVYNLWTYTCVSLVEGRCAQRVSVRCAGFQAVSVYSLNVTICVWGWFSDGGAGECVSLYHRNN